MKLNVLLLAAALTGPSFHLAAAELPPSPSAKLDALFEDKVIAKADGVEVKQSELDESFTERRAAMAARGQTIPEMQRASIEYQLVEQLVIAKLLTGMATDADKAKAKERVDKVYEENAARFPTPEAFQQQLRMNGLTPETFKEKALTQITWQTVLEGALRPKISVTDEAVRNFYTNNPARFEKPEQVRASHILVSTLDKTKNPPTPLPDAEKAAKLAEARAIRERAEKGEDFAALARQHSDDPGSKDRGGEYTFPRGQMVPPFEAAAFSLEPGKVSDIVETTFGYHVIKLHEKIPAEVVPLETVFVELKEALETQEIQKLIPEYVERLKKDKSVEISLPLPEALRTVRENALKAATPGQ